MRNINNILRKNRRLLEQLIPEEESTAKTPRKKLMDMGYNFNYHTHQYTNKKGDVYVFCYDYGYLVLENEWMLVVRKQN